MPLEVIIESTSEPPGLRSYWGYAPGSEHICSFEHEAVYWFLHPLFEKLKEQTGKYIDIYGWCSFGGDELTALLTIITMARTMIKEKPECWEVVTGFSGDTGEEVFEKVSKQEFQIILNQLSRAIQKAIKYETYLAFAGD